jgi:hypothetical protein
MVKDNIAKIGDLGCAQTLPEGVEEVKSNSDVKPSKEP